MPGGGEEKGLIERRGVSDVRAQKLAAIEFGQQRAAVERIDDQIVPVDRARRAHQEVAGKVDAGDLEAGAARDFHVDHRETDRDPSPPVEHFVEKAVARVLVVLTVAGEALFVEQVLVENLDRLGGRDTDTCEPGSGGVPHRVDAIEIGLRVEGRILDAGDRERGRRDIRAGRVQRLLEVVGDLRNPRIQIEGVGHQCGL